MSAGRLVMFLMANQNRLEVIASEFKKNPDQYNKLLEENKAVVEGLRQKFPEKFEQLRTMGVPV